MSDKEKNKRKILKMIISGDVGVGKEELRKKYIGEILTKTYTSGTAFSVKRFQ